MKFSVIIPAYNCENTLERTVESIRRSGLTDYEIWLIDDGSRDGTPAVCDALCARFPEVHCVHQENAGVSAARNRGLAEAEGEYVVFVDSDDAWAPFRMEDIGQAVAGHADMIVFGMEFQFFRKGKLVRTEQYSCGQTQRLTAPELADMFRHLFEINYLSSACNKFLRRTLIAEHRLRFNPELTNYEDLDFILQFLPYCETGVLLEQCCYLYQSVFDVDHTDQRLARIPDIMGNTDIIAQSVFRYDEAVFRQTGKHLEGVFDVVLQIYQGIFFSKLATVPYSRISGYCADFAADPYVRRCLEQTEEVPEAVQRICRGDVNALWLRKYYGKIRHWTAVQIKLILFTLGVRKSI